MCVACYGHGSVRGYDVSGRELAFSGEASANLPASCRTFCQITNQSSLDVEDQGAYFDSMSSEPLIAVLTFSERMSNDRCWQVEVDGDGLYVVSDRIAFVLTISLSQCYSRCQRRPSHYLSAYARGGGRGKETDLEVLSDSLERFLSLSYRCQTWQKRARY